MVETREIASLSIKCYDILFSIIMRHKYLDPAKREQAIYGCPKSTVSLNVLNILFGFTCGTSTELRIYQLHRYELLASFIFLVIKKLYRSYFMCLTVRNRCTLPSAISTGSTGLRLATYDTAP